MCTHKILKEKEMKKIIIILGLASLIYGVTIGSTNTVVDNTTRLEWQNQTINKDMEKTWQESLDYCRDLVLDEKEDWRLPNILELDSLVDDSLLSSPLILEAFKENTGSTFDSEYWSSTSEKVSNGKFSYARTIDFQNGELDSTYKTHETFSPRKMNVRCVRDSQ